MISSYLIIYRVVEGRAWNSETFSKTGGGLTSLAFDTTLSKNTKSTGDTDDTRTDPQAIDIPLGPISGRDGTLKVEDEKKQRGIKVSTRVDDTVTEVTDKSSSVMWVAKEVV